MARPGLPLPLFRPVRVQHGAIYNGLVTTGPGVASGNQTGPNKRQDRVSWGAGPRTAVAGPARCWRGDAWGLTPPGGRQMSAMNGMDRSAQGTAEGTAHPEPSRRSVLHGAAGLAGAGLAATVMAGTLAAPASASAAPR